MEEIGIGVAIAVISAVVIGALALLWRNRDAISTRARERLCSHEWEPINKPGDGVALIAGYAEWCVKCGARR